MLGKLVASLIAVLVLLVTMPALLTYLLMSARMGMFFSPTAFLGGVGIMTIHTIFYLTLTIMLGTLFESRIPILGIALGMVMGGSLIGGIIQPLMYVMPWTLGKIASLIADGQTIPNGILWPPLIASLLWSVVFTLIALAKFEKKEF